MMRFKRLLILAGALLALLILALLAIKLFISPQRISSAIVPRMQEILDRQVSVASSELSFFPPGVRISNLVIANKPPFETKPLAHIDHMDADVQLFPLLLGRIKIKELVIDGWEMLLEKDSLGAVNYDFFSARTIFPDQKDQIQEPLCRRFRLNDGRLLFRNDSTGVRFVLGNIRLSYDLKGERLSDISGELEIDSLFLWADAGNFLIYPDAVQADWRGFYSALHDSVAFRRCNWRIDAFAGRLDGAIANIGVKPAFNLRLLSEHTELADCQDSRILSAIPLLREMDLSGQTRIDISYAGIAGNPATNTLRGKISLTDFTATTGPNGYDLRSKLVESNFNERTMSVYTESALVDGAPTSLRITVDDYKEPTISGELTVNCDAALVAKLLEVAPSTRVSGDVSANLSGFIKTSDPDQSRIFGSLLLDQISVVDSARTLGVDNFMVDMQFTGDHALVTRCDLAIGDNNLQLSGDIADFPMLFTTGLETRRRPFLDGVISSESFDFDTLAYFGNAASSDTGAIAKIISRLVDLNCSAHIQFAKGKLAGIEFTDLESRLSVVNRIAYSDSATCRMLGGKVSGDVVVDLNRLLQPDIEIEAHAEEIQADAFLNRFTRFGTNLSGDLDLQVTAKWLGTSTAAALSSLVLRGEAVVEDGHVEAFDLSRKCEESLGIPAFEKGKIEDLVCSFLFADQTFRFTTLAFDSGDIEYGITGSISSSNNLEFGVNRKVSKDEVRTLRARPDFIGVAGDKTPKTVTIDVKGNPESPLISISGVR